MCSTNLGFSVEKDCLGFGVGYVFFVVSIVQQCVLYQVRTYVDHAYSSAILYYSANRHFHDTQVPLM